VLVSPQKAEAQPMRTVLVIGIGPQHMNKVNRRLPSKRLVEKPWGESF